jgi:hypothetical protein
MWLKTIVYSQKQGKGQLTWSSGQIFINKFTCHFVQLIKTLSVYVIKVFFCIGHNTLIISLLPLLCFTFTWFMPTKVDSIEHRLLNTVKVFAQWFCFIQHFNPVFYKCIELTVRLVHWPCRHFAGIGCVFSSVPYLSVQPKSISDSIHWNLSFL